MRIFSSSVHLHALPNLMSLDDEAGDTFMIKPINVPEWQIRHYDAEYTDSPLVYVICHERR
jgi:hypothetical protein